MREIQFREALREAMVEEMRRDEKIFLMGEEVGHYQGAYGAGSDTDVGGGREPQYSTEARCRLAEVIGEQQGRSLKTKGGFT